jgi:hypothetical protein
MSTQQTPGVGPAIENLQNAKAAPNPRWHAIRALQCLYRYAPDPKPAGVWNAISDLESGLASLYVASVRDACGDALVCLAEATKQYASAEATAPALKHGDWAMAIVNAKPQVGYVHECTSPDGETELLFHKWGTPPVWSAGWKVAPDLMCHPLSAGWVRDAGLEVTRPASGSPDGRSQ